jgi:hypothetical protein
MYATTLSLFDRVNIANCAAQRARNNLMNDDRFTGEFQTVKCWTNYRCYIGTRMNGEQFHYVEHDGILI